MRVVVEECLLECFCVRVVVEGVAVQDEKERKENPKCKRLDLHSLPLPSAAFCFSCAVCAFVVKLLAGDTGQKRRLAKP